MFPRALLAAAAAGLIGPWMAVSGSVCAATPKAMSKAALHTASPSGARSSAARPDAIPSAATQPVRSSAADATTQPVASGSKYDDDPISSSEDSGDGGGSGGAGGDESITGNIGNMAMSLLFVVGLIVVGVLVLRRLFPGMRGGNAGGPVQVIGKHFLSPKQQLFLVKIGSRVVVIGAAGGNLSQVCQITDAEEIASLVSQCEQAGSTSVSRSFRGLFASKRGQLRDALAEDADGVEGEQVGEVREELDSAVGRLRRFLSSRRGDE